MVGKGRLLANDHKGHGTKKNIYKTLIGVLVCHQPSNEKIYS